MCSYIQADIYTRRNIDVNRREWKLHFTPSNLSAISFLPNFAEGSTDSYNELVIETLCRYLKTLGSYQVTISSWWFYDCDQKSTWPLWLAHRGLHIVMNIVFIAVHYFRDKIWFSAMSITHTLIFCVKLPTCISCSSMVLFNFLMNYFIWPY